MVKISYAFICIVHHSATSQYNLRLKNAILEPKGEFHNTDDSRFSTTHMNPDSFLGIDKLFNLAPSSVNTEKM